MNITSFSGLSGVQQQQSIQRASAKLGAAIAAIVSGDKLAAAGNDVAELSVAGQLQAALGGLRKASGNLAQSSSLAQVADGGIAQLSEVAQQLQTLAQTAASPTLSDEARDTLDQQFKELVKQIDQTVLNTAFGGRNLLDGSVSGSGALSLNSLLGASNDTNDNVLSIESLISSNLFGGQSLNLTTADGASSAFAVIGDALHQLTGARAHIGSFLQSLDFAAANIDTAIANQDAARSTLADTDFAETASPNSQATLQLNAGLALAAQGNRLTPALLQLVG